MFKLKSEVKNEKSFVKMYFDNSQHLAGTSLLPRGAQIYNRLSFTKVLRCLHKLNNLIKLNESKVIHKHYVYMQLLQIKLAST